MEWTNSQQYATTATVFDRADAQEPTYLEPSIVGVGLGAAEGISASANPICSARVVAEIRRGTGCGRIVRRMSRRFSSISPASQLLDAGFKDIPAPASPQYPLSGETKARRNSDDAQDGWGLPDQVDRPTRVHNGPQHRTRVRSHRRLRME